jgi:hypothetical protein
VARDGLRQRPGWPRGLAAAVLAWAWLTFGMEALGAIGLLARGPLLGWVALGMSVAAGCRFLAGKDTPADASPPDADAGGGWGWDGVLTVGLTLWAVSTLGASSLLMPVKVVSDGPIYHLPFAIQWWKAGKLALIPAPFGESAAPYFPAVGDLWFCWLVIGWGGDRLAKIGQAPFLLLAAMTAYALARRLGAGRSAAVVATTWFVTSTPLLLFSFEANVDTVFIAGYLLAAYFFLRYALGDDGLPALVLGGLAAGSALGTKAVGVVFVPPLLACGLLAAVRGGATRAGKVGGVVIVLTTPFVASGFWYARDAWLTGNPVYPLHLEALGSVWLAGWYGPEVMRLSQYYIPVSHWRAFGDIMLGVLDPRLTPVWLAALGGAWAWGRRETSRSPLDRWVWLAAALAVANVALYWLVVPYRTQQRFMLQALGLAAVPLARLFDRGRVVRAVGVALLAAHVLTPQGWPLTAPRAEPPWDLTRDIKNNVPGLLPIPQSAERLRATLAEPAALQGLVAVLSLSLLALQAARFWGRAGARGRRWVRAALATIVLGVSAGLVVYPWGADARQVFFPRFPDYYVGWLELDLRSGPRGVRVAYAGTDLPYYLMGVGLRNDVRYVNIDAHRGWLLHDYHRETRRAGSQAATWGHPRPGWDRAHPDYDAWLANLRAEGVQLLVVTRANPDEGPYNPADAEGFPIERVWADAHPEAFERVYGFAPYDPLFKIHRVRSNHSESRG